MHPDGAYAWFRLAIAILLSTLGGVGMWSVVVVLPAVQAEFGVDRAGASLPYTLAMIGFAVGNLVVGRWVDRAGIILPVIGSALSLSAGYALAAVAPSLLVFALIQGALIGFGTAATFGPLLADVSHWFQRRRGIAIACAASGNYIAGALWPTFIKWGLAAGDWRSTYLAIAVILLVTMVPLTLLLRTRRHAGPLVRPGEAGPSGGGRGPRDLGLSPAALQGLLVLAGLACCIAMSMPQVHIVAYCVDLGYGVAPGAEMLALMMMGGIVSRLVSGVIADRFGGLVALLVGSVGQGLALALYIPFDGLTSLYVVSLVFGLSQGGIVPSYAVIVREYLPAQEAGQRIGFVIMATIFGMAIGGWMSGFIYDLTGSYTAAFLNGAAWNLVNAAVVLSLLLRDRRTRRVAMG
ncbi:MFS transporter [Pannonibacter tanglangensis]|uniref:MFS transporter n=1 Tax=Pannonibacter tanglangensis TaxID=2750084 RepID=A0ABW9ZDL3_9HYPH|nr:MFS transporter [Pannonibacter sp. XCT-34]NBN62935.1 MFS transporter [Pannonibacter sp. XCT-34]